jgi:cell fate regulator YaaT (PSP1 superfamily)
MILPWVVGIRFKPAGKIYYFDSDNQDYDIGSKAIVETVRGIECGTG